MELKEYSYVLAVAQSGGVTKAAQKLFISQPSLSTYLKNLEQRLGITFFERAEGRLTPTPEGRIYLETAEKILQLHQDAQSRLQSLHRLDEGVVRLGITVTRGAFLLPDIIAVFRQKHPGVTVQITEATTRELERLVERRELDFILINQSAGVKDLEYEVLYEEEIVITVPSALPLCGKGRILPGCRWPWMDLRYLEPCDFILLKPGQKMRQNADQILAQAGFSPRVLLETNSALTAYNCSKKGLGLSFITDTYCVHMGYQNDGLKIFSVGSPCIKNKLVISYPHGCHLSRAAQAMIWCIHRQSFA